MLSSESAVRGPIFSAICAAIEPGGASNTPDEERGGEGEEAIRGELAPLCAERAAELSANGGAVFWGATTSISASSSISASTASSSTLGIATSMASCLVIMWLASRCSMSRSKMLCVFGVCGSEDSTGERLRGTPPALESEPPALESERLLTC